MAQAGHRADDKWELYDQNSDFTQAHDLASAHPERLKAMIDLWWVEARRHQALSLDDRFRERVADTSRPSASRPRDVYRYYPGTSPIPNQPLPVTLNCRHSFTARLVLDAASDEGLLVGQGTALSGWALFVQRGRGVYVSNCVKVAMTEVTTPAPLPVGREVALSFEHAAPPEPVVIGQPLRVRHRPPADSRP